MPFRRYDLPCQNEEVHSHAIRAFEHPPCANRLLLAICLGVIAGSLVAVSALVIPAMRWALPTVLSLRSDSQAATVGMSLTGSAVLVGAVCAVLYFRFRDWQERLIRAIAAAFEKQDADYNRRFLFVEENVPSIESATLQ